MHVSLIGVRTFFDNAHDFIDGLQHRDRSASRVYTQERQLEARSKRARSPLIGSESSDLVTLPVMRSNVESNRGSA